jgi:3-deoxy-D-manno-octulosonic-acid transferase
VSPPGRRPLPLALYAAATGLLEPLAPALLRRRAAAGKEDPARLPERLGHPAQPRPQGELVWLHGVSVGESLSLLPLVRALRARRPALSLLVTSGTVTSASVLAARLPPGVIHQFAPVDSPRAAARFLDHWRPAAALFVESELWPNLILAARARGVRLGLISARMTQASAAGWARAAGSAATLLGAFEAVLPQDEATARRLSALGARVGPRLNLKRLAEAPPVDAGLSAAITQALGPRPAVLAASTHPGEERLIGEAFREAAGDLSAVLLVAPRHPDRGPEAAETLCALGFAVARRGAGEPLAADISAYVIDTLGELGTFYAAAEVVVMGGGFAEGVGGHNPLEAARLGRPIVTGPHVANARSLYDELLADVAAIEARDGAALARHLRGLLANPAIARRIGEAAEAFATREAAALESALAAIAPLLPA